MRGAFVRELRALNVVKERPLALFQILGNSAVDGLEMGRSVLDEGGVEFVHQAHPRNVEHAAS